MVAQRVSVLTFAALTLVAGCAREESEATGDSAAGVAAPPSSRGTSTMRAKRPTALRPRCVFFVSNTRAPREQGQQRVISARAEWGEIDSLMFIAGGAAVSRGTHRKVWPSLATPSGSPTSTPYAPSTRRQAARLPPTRCAAPFSSMTLPLAPMAHSTSPTRAFRSPPPE